MAEEETETLKDILDHVDLEGNGISTSDRIFKHLNISVYFKFVKDCTGLKIFEM